MNQYDIAHKYLSGKNHRDSLAKDILEFAKNYHKLQVALNQLKQ